ncbi:receptor-type adenylate cyclase GRESAG 4,putative [Trypanosoma brucei gambiense DAL972]|uniref:adenylate cyclase n=1 Tax=Trypanosoma brucei gambiense (strain MHOM/CI/86/DAL972) TaxID=679716 RepID=D0A9R3_TRYB9|nr:receptor-type adenylate cyclase GRESAG 4,putative [Trypanosoma brucei gambiense DAL972]CBH18414.1 receptor-type adenylate cyclase GRESAG 4,putative [Trypanosoma brucei gambiense DAL972]|eukprot:XP_011780678.1 receptor-type adenylate cyclase GRESAG 4,putative [Trypanosoma brucei gambiense DAL972]
MTTTKASCYISSDSALRRNSIAATAPLLLLLALTLPVGNGEVTQVNVLSLMYTTEFPVEDAVLFDKGLNVSLMARRLELKGQVKVEFIRPAAPDSPIDVAIEQGAQQSVGKLLLVLGPLGDDNIQIFKGAMEEHELVAFTPIATSSEGYGWDPHLYYLTVGPDAELMALVRYAVGVLGLQRVGVMYVKDTSFSRKSFEFVEKLMMRMGHNISCVFAPESGFSSAGNKVSLDSEWEQFAAALPQAILLLGPRGRDSRWFVMRVAEDNRTSRSHLLAQSGLQSFLLKTWCEALEATGAEFRTGQVIFSGTNPLACDTEYKAVQRFIDETKRYLGNEEEGSEDAGAGGLSNDTGGEMMMLGWMTGEVISAALGNSRVVSNRTAFMESLYYQRRYVVDDLVIGDYGNECGEEAIRQGAVCRCNQGGSMVYMKEMVSKTLLRPVTAGYVTLGMSRCSRESLQLNAPLNALLLLMQDDDVALRANVDWDVGASASVGNGHLTVHDRLFLHSFLATSDAAASILQQLLSVRIVSAVFGVVSDDMLEIEGMTFFDPITTTPRLTKPRKNVIYLSPTMEQQLYVLAEYLYSNPPPSVKAIIRSKEASEISKLLRKTLLTFDAPLSPADILDDDDELGDYLPTEGDVMVIGLTKSDVGTIAEHLETFEESRVFLIFSELALLFEELRAAFRNKASAHRLVFATNLPHWAEIEMPTDRVDNLNSVVPDRSLWSPMALLGFVTGRLMESILERMENVNPGLLADLFFKESLITVDGMWYGPYTDDCDIGKPIEGNHCIHNYGATHISVWSMARVLRSDVPLLQNPTTPSMEYIDPDAVVLTGAAIAGIGIAVFASLLLLAALGALLYFTMNRTRDNASAPKEPMEPVTIIFTDIESSTAIWAAHPELMPDAVAAHHRVIRRLIEKYDCYEVKTVGDSFMIACKGAYPAARLVWELQVSFLNHDWGTGVFDEIYRDAERERRSEDREYNPPTAYLDSEVYSRLWHGLRVRIGIHTGLCDIRRDEVTKGYDYYGQTTNMAARTESVANGGQVLMTRGTYFSLSSTERQEFGVTSLGLVPLRGVPEPVEMYQLDAIAGRVFAPLRFDREACCEQEDGTSTSASDHGSTVFELSESAQWVVASLRAVLRAFSTSQRQKLLMPICERWNVSIPRKPLPMWGEEHCEAIMRSIGAKIGSVVDHPAATDATMTGSTVTNDSVIFISGNPEAQR